MITKINHMGLIGSGDKSYLKDRWCQFDAVMLFFILISVILQVCPLTKSLFLAYWTVMLTETWICLESKSISPFTHIERPLV